MSLLFGLASGPDLLRLLAVPVFAWAAYRDVRTRRVPNRTWMPLVAVGLVALGWDAWLLADATGFERQLYVVQLVVSVGLVAPLGYLFWRLGGFGGADAKAVITLAVVLPTYPVYYLGAYALPLQEAPLGVFSLTILSNTVLVGLLYPLALAVRNLPRGEVTPAMFVGRPVAVDAVRTEYGRLLETPAGFTRRGLDLDALRMYLAWRGGTFEELRADPDRYRLTVPTDTNDPGDGSLSIDDRAMSDGGTTVGEESLDRNDGEVGPVAGAAPEDPWGAERFLAEHSAYGTTVEELCSGLAVLAESDRERVWITPGIPFVVPMFVGLVLALTFGDLLYWALGLVGLA